MKKILLYLPFVLAAWLAQVVLAETVAFQLLTWNDSNDTSVYCSAVGLKPSVNDSRSNDWLLFTDDDHEFEALYNPIGAISHNFADISGSVGSGFNNFPSLTGNLHMVFTSTGPETWDVTISNLFYYGKAQPAPQATMNQFLVTPGSFATTNPAYNVDGLGNCGTWCDTPASNWAISYQIDFFFDAAMDSYPPKGDDVDSAYNDKMQTGYLIPVDQLTTAGLVAVALDDPAGFYTNDFEQYLLDEIVPRLPEDAVYLLFTQMLKTHPNYTDPAYAITTNSFIGNTTLAYTTQEIIPEPTTALWGCACLAIAALITHGALINRNKENASL